MAGSTDGDRCAVTGNWSRGRSGAATATRRPPDTVRPGRQRLHDESVSKITARQDVNNEVDGRVEDDEYVADGRVVVVPVATRSLRLVDERPEDVVDEGRRLTDDEDTHDDNKNERDVLLVPSLTHLRPSALASLQRHNQFDVEEPDKEQRATVYNDEIENIVVKDSIQAIVTER